MKPATLCGSVALVLAPWVASPAAAAMYRCALTITRTTGLPLTDAHVAVDLTAANFNYANVDPAGAVMRLTDSDGTTPLPYYRESWNPGGTSTLWVRVPGLPGSGTKTLYLFYAPSPGDFVPTASDFSATFPNAYMAPPGNSTLTPTPAVDPWEAADWFEVGLGSTVFTGLGGPAPEAFIVNARRIRITGTIQATGKGYFPTSSAAEGGPGRGGPGFTFTSGGGGGGHGGAGGVGGEEDFQPGGAGGTTYGSASDATIQPGSSGGSTFQLGLNGGGPGGGVVRLTAQKLDLTGTIHADGGPGIESEYGGGGGSGGSVLFLAHEVRLQGTITARGGDGRGFYQSGGGGGGGRIKVFHENAPVGTPVLSASGGSVGPGGPFSYPEPGAAGSIHVGSASLAQLDYDERKATVGPEENVLSVEPVATSGIRVGMPVPNPARAAVTLAIGLDQAADGEVEILDLQGRRVRSLVRESLGPGPHEWTWDLRDDGGRPVAVGMFLARVRIADRTWTRRIVVAQ